MIESLWAKHVDQTFLSQSAFPGLFDHFIVTMGIRTANLICQIIDFQETCDPCCSYVLLLRPQAGSHEKPRLAGRSMFGNEGEI